MKTFKWLSVAVIAALVFGLPGCGGGGGGGGISTSSSTTAPSSPPPPTSTGPVTATLQSVVPAVGSSIPVNGSIVLTYAVTNYMGVVTNDISLSCADKVIPLGSGGITDLPPPSGGVAITFSLDRSVTPVNVSCLLSGNFVFFGASDVTNGMVTGGLKVPVSYSFTGTPAPGCTSPAVFSPGSGVCLYPVGVKVAGAPLLPIGCATESQSCFKDTAHFVASGVQVNGRAVMAAIFQNNVTLWYNETLLYVDDGTLVDVPGNSVIGGGTAMIDWGEGTSTGFAFSIGGQCITTTYDATTGKWAASLNCPS